MTRRIPWAPLLLAAIALWDLRSELKLLAEHFTWISLLAIPRFHFLAVTVLLLTPTLMRQSRQPQR
ncbi:hypothetical protein MY494_01150 [Synechococcus sp. A10-1-5-1]|uniref:hypothetical protein n=1 Tax=Synechococcus sp. A10-1-5-1 TaxID=2936507 RepID=UPI00200092AD|nr:hypothetical protein [Synechococcus sp. A10-1-5-1]UPM50440.1 hypothetical protein MY494_01150 [Synechococcus sp. A10-1-5-1]